jgi:hypothetical protein
LQDTDLRPVGFQFVRHNERDPGTNALSHFRAMRNNRYPAVIADLYEHQWIVNDPVWHGIGAVLRGIRGLCNVPTVGDEQQPTQCLKSQQEFSAI